MEQASMTALISAFSRAHHAAHHTPPVFNDSRARQLLSEAEYAQISQTMAAGIGFFNPAFVGTPEEALGWIVDHQLSPTPLCRAAFAEAALENAVRLGARQYVILGAGYDTFAYRQPGWAAPLQIFEVDHPATARDKQARLMRAGIVPPENVHFVATDFSDPAWPAALTACPAFSPSKITCCALLGLIYYLPRATFANLLAALGDLLPEGSTLAFDYPDLDGQTAPADGQTQRQAQLAQGAGEAMQACYAPAEMERLLADHGFLAYEHLTPPAIAARFFPNGLAPASHVNLCLAVKKQ